MLGDGVWIQRHSVRWVFVEILQYQIQQTISYTLCVGKLIWCAPFWLKKIKSIAPVDTIIISTKTNTIPVITIYSNSLLCFGHV